MQQRRTRSLSSRLVRHSAESLQDVGAQYQRVAKTWTSHNVEFHQISFEDNREFCKDVLGITKLPWTQVLAPSRGHAEVIADGSSIGKLESSLRKTVLDVDVDDLGI
jgi:hypothetical protein